ncbi:uncharacterized protein LOC114904093 [Monodon monoceros]|uniref:uncharacterized protein LOC114904093 n=1 Tax=Monodon monoceros TaxID=40151 RepID=UPI0010F4B959|nr:uncharacterized protein LOC114904093 [Monodon monoceros]
MGGDNSRPWSFLACPQHRECAWGGGLTRGSCPPPTQFGARPGPCGEQPCQAPVSVGLALSVCVQWKTGVPQACGSRRLTRTQLQEEGTRRQHPGKPDYVPMAPEMEMAELRLDPGGRPEALEMLDVQCSVTLRAAGPGNLEGRPAGPPEVTGDRLNGARSPGPCPRRSSWPQCSLLSLSEVLFPLRLGEGLGHPRPSSVCRGSAPGVQHPPPTLHPPPAHLPCGTHGVLPGSSLAGGRGG